MRGQGPPSSFLRGRATRCGSFATRDPLRVPRPSQRAELGCLGASVCCSGGWGPGLNRGPKSPPALPVGGLRHSLCVLSESLTPSAKGSTPRCGHVFRPPEGASCALGRLPFGPSVAGTGPARSRAWGRDAQLFASSPGHTVAHWLLSELLMCPEGLRVLCRPALSLAMIPEAIAGRRVVTVSHGREVSAGGQADRTAPSGPA
ncbi:MAG: hypothetical protein QOC85_2803 [Streptomyces sp.]|nr:hypothetical protein [Streptomyces sp.]